jgi:UDP-N-acetylmuramate--alanine ligase
VCEGIKGYGHKDAVHISGKEQVMEHLQRTLAPGDLLLTLGAGDVWKLGEALLEKLRA